LELVFVTNAGVIGDAAWHEQVCLKVANQCSFPSMNQTTPFRLCKCKCCWQVLVPAWVWWGSIKRPISRTLLKAGWSGGSTCVERDVTPCFGKWTLRHNVVLAMLDIYSHAMTCQRALCYRMAAALLTLRWRWVRK
jgi:hypothetical protein